MCAVSITKRHLEHAAEYVKALAAGELPFSPQETEAVYAAFVQLFRWDFGLERTFDEQRFRLSCGLRVPSPTRATVENLTAYHKEYESQRRCPNKDHPPTCPGGHSPTKKELCPYAAHADDCECRGEGGDR